MILLEKGTLNQKNVIFPESMQLDIEERSSRAVLQLGPEAPEISIGDWMRDDSGPGAGIVWRVAAVEPSYETGERRVTLEHIISELKDTIIFGELKLNGSATNALQKILNRSEHWMLGSCAYSKSLPYEFDGDTLFEAVEGVCETLEDSCWDYDLSSLPFKLHIRQLGSDVGSEMRAGRNIKTIRKTIDKSNMYTRFYPIGKEELKLSGSTKYVSRNEDKYGTISRSETNQAISSQSMLRAWAEGRLARHCDPTVNITVEGLELADATGEPLDRFTVLTMCRIPIPEIGEIITERITKLSYRDKIGNPETVTVTMSNKTEDVMTLTSQIREENAKTRSGGRAGSKKAEEDHAWFTDTTEHVSMTAEAIVGKNPDGSVDWGRVADITVNGNGIYSTVTKTEKDMVTAQSKIEQLENSINLTVQAIGGADGKITAASIALAINKNGSNAIISADHISLNGTTKLNEVLQVNGTSAYFARPVYFNYNGTQGSFSGGTLRARSIYTDTNRLMHVADVTVSGNTLTVTYDDGTTKNFSKATTLEGAWNSSRKLTVNAYQINSGTRTLVGTFETTVVGSIAAADFTDWDDYWGTAKLHALVGSSETPITIGNVLVNAKAAYDAGKASVPSYSNSAVLTFVRFDDDYEEYIYRSEDLITRQSAGATKTVHYN